jgi:hypothetical protein
LTRSLIDVEEIIGVPATAVVEWDLPSWPRRKCMQCAAGDEPERAFDLN